MKNIFLLLVILINFSFKGGATLSKTYPSKNDTILINHTLDGNINEWPLAKFELNKETEIKYAVDNDAKNLYVAMIIPKFATQIKMIRQGMEFYIDLKGKKREGKGIEFPIKSEAPNNFDFNNTKDINKKGIISIVSMNLLSLKLLGFSDGNAEPVKQSISTKGSVNIQSAWDSADVMYVEYNIPLSLLGENSSTQKVISLGWKINGVEMQSNNRVPVYTTREIVAVPAGSLPPSQSRISNRSTISSSKQPNMDSKMKEQSFWTKYTISIPAK